MFYHIKQYVELYNVEPVLALAKNCMYRCLGMRDTVRLKAKRVKELSITCQASVLENFTEKVKEDYFNLQDSIAELKRSLAESVDWCNKE